MMKVQGKWIESTIAAPSTAKHQYDQICWQCRKVMGYPPKDGLCLPCRAKQHRSGEQWKAKKVRKFANRRRGKE